MNSTTLLASLAAYLAPPVQEAGGSVEVSGTVEDTLAALAQSPARWRCLLQWQREEAQGSTRTAVEGRFVAIVQQARGLGVEAGADVAKNRAGDPALLGRMEFVRQLLRAARWDRHDIDHLGPQLRSTYWITDPRFPTRQIAIEFSIMFGLDVITPALIPV